MSENFGRVGVLYGGRSAERDVSLMSGNGVYEALRSAEGLPVRVAALGELVAP